MDFLTDDSRPIFMQIATKIEDDIINGILTEEAPVPSTNQLAAMYQINPATAAKGVNLLVDQGILYKKRGVGMFVVSGAYTQLLAKHREHFFQQYVVKMVDEAQKLQISKEALIEMIQKVEKNA